jgi:hypothetical protein
MAAAAPTFCSPSELAALTAVFKNSATAASFCERLAVAGSYGGERRGLIGWLGPTSGLADSGRACSSAVHARAAADRPLRRRMAPPCTPQTPPAACPAGWTA